MTQEFSKSVDQLCTQLSISNIAVPKIDSYKNVFEFISDFEMATTMLPDHQRIKLMAKAFPAGRYMAWYDENIKSHIESSSWGAIKTKIIERYSDTEDRDRHLRRLDSMKYNPDGSIKLFDFVEEILFSFSKAFPKEDEDTKIRYIKNKLPVTIIPTLLTIQQYNSATKLEDFLKAIRQFDILKVGLNKSEDTTNEKLKLGELVTVIKDLVEGIKQQTSTKVVSALTSRSASPVDPRRGRMIDNSNLRRESSPGRNNYPRQYERSPSPYRRYEQRSPSPARRSSHNYNNYNRYNNEQYYGRHTNRDYQQNNYNRPNNYQHNIEQGSTNNNQLLPYQRGRSPPPRNYYQNRYPMENNYNTSAYSRPHQTITQNENKASNAFDSDHYFQRFGYPSTPCPNCQAMHWVRHCPENLK